MRIIVRAVFLMCAACSVMVYCAGPSHAQLFSNPMIGKKAPDANLQTTQAGEQSLSSIIEGKKAILVFWATWCPHCREQLKMLSEKREALESAGIVVQLVDIGESKDAVEKFLKDKGYDFNVMLDTDSAAAEVYQVVGIPTLVFIGNDGKIRDVQYALMSEYEKVLE